MNHELLGVSTLSFVAFCIAANAIYYLIDLLDSGDDRRYHLMRLRHFTSVFEKFLLIC